MDFPPEVKEQIEEQKKQCPFCKIVSGEISSQKVFEDDSFLVVMDIRPATRGHVLVVPKEHYPILPYVPQDVFGKMFGLLPEIADGVQKALVCFGSTIFLANGGVAGQQSSHFLFHVFPREKGDGLGQLDIQGKSVDDAKHAELAKALSSGIPVLMRRLFSQVPASWHRGSGSTPVFLEGVRSDSFVLYEDEKVLVVSARNVLVPGQVSVYSKESEKVLEVLSSESSSHLFRAASVASSAVFELAKAQGTNILLRSGRVGDSGDVLRVDIIPRMADDGLSLSWTPVAEGADPDIASRIRDNLFFVGKEGAKPKSVSLERVEEPVKATHFFSSAREEIEAAILRVVGS